MNRQDAFNAAFLGLRAQDFELSRRPDGGCVYRGPRNLRCAVGHMIPDAVYIEDIEDCRAAHLVRNFPQLASHLLLEPDFLEELQTVHDEAKSPDDLQHRLLAFAIAHNLEVPQ